jgi:hypothetical protein
MDTFIFVLLLYKAVKIGRGVRLLNVIVRNGSASSCLLENPSKLTYGDVSRYHLLHVRYQFPPNRRLNLTRRSFDFSVLSFTNLTNILVLRVGPFTIGYIRLIC